MDKDTFDKMLKMMESENDADAVMGLRGFQAMLKGEQVQFSKALGHIIKDIEQLKEKAAPAAAAAPAAKAAPLEVSGMPQCQSPQEGVIMIIPPGQTAGEPVLLPGESAAHSRDIAAMLKDALVAAAINKSRFKLKLVDVKDKRGDTTETILQAEYDRDGMSPVKIWSNVKGEAAALATVLRRTVSSAMPDMMA
jgi:hypothetical protein